MSGREPISGMNAADDRGAAPDQEGEKDMSCANYGAVQQYSSVGVDSAVAFASPHRLVQMLLDGVLARLSAAKGGIESGDVPRRGEHIGRAISIIEGLRASLDRDAGGEMAVNLDNLYEYIGLRLLRANLNADPAILDEVASLIGEIKQGWDAIANDPAAQVPGPAQPASLVSAFG